MKKPNFFIVGAPKCGTTSLATWLSGHSNIYFSPVKEPNYFNTDMHIPSRMSSNEYYKLFANAQKQHTVIGEASTRYLCSKVAILNILKNQPEAKFIAIVRNPLELAPSLHQHLVFNGNEPLADFSQAWDAGLDRESGRGIPRFCRDRDSIIYANMCLLGNQVSRMFEFVREDYRKIILFDDLVSEPQKTFLNVLNFLDVDSDFSPDYSIYNAARIRKSKLLAQILLASSRFRNIFGIQRGFGIITKLNKMNTLEKKQTNISPETIRLMSSYFKNDIKKLGKLLERNLSHWLPKEYE